MKLADVITLNKGKVNLAFIRLLIGLNLLWPDVSCAFGDASAPDKLHKALWRATQRDLIDQRDNPERLLPDSAGRIKTFPPELLSLPHIDSPNAFQLEISGFTALFGQQIVQVPALSVTVPPHQLVDIWVDCQGEARFNFSAPENYLITPRHEQDLYLLRIKSGASNIQSLALRANMGLIEDQLSYQSYDLNNFIHQMIVPAADTQWAARTAVNIGTVLSTSQGELFRVVQAGYTGDSEPIVDKTHPPEPTLLAANTEVITIADVDPQTEFYTPAILEYLGPAQFSGAWKMSRQGGIHWYFSNIAAGLMAKHIPQQTKTYLLLALKNLVRDWGPNRKIEQGMRIYGLSTQGNIWEAMTSGVTAQTSPFKTNSTTAEMIHDASVVWRSIGQMQGSPSWFLSDTQSDMRTHRAPDSHDSYAATLLWAIHQYVSATGDIAWLMQDSVHQGYSNAQVLKEVLYTNLLTQFDGGLTKTFQHDISPQGVFYPVRFLMDNCEVWAGLNAAVQIFNILGDFQFAHYVDSFRQTSQQGIETLWQAEAGAYRWALGQDMTKPAESFYPTINSQYWPALWGVPLASNNISAAINFADNHYQFWWRRQDIDDFANLGAHYALVEKLGRIENLEAILQTVRQRSFRQVYSNALAPSELLVSDAAYYLNLLMRQEETSAQATARPKYGVAQ